MTPQKLVISGPVGAGKTTFIRTLSETPVIDTDVETTENIGKSHTTVSFDFGTLDLDGQALHLYGTPGQDRFDFMWDVLCHGALGLVLLIAGDQPRDFPNARRILEFITSRNAIPFVVGVTRQDLDCVWSPQDVAAYFRLPEPHVVGVNATDPHSARDVLARLLTLIVSPSVLETTWDPRVLSKETL